MEGNYYRKTRICKFWPYCRFGTACKFAHGDTDLKKAGPKPSLLTKYKTKRCKYYTEEDGYANCPYGARCYFSHEERVCPFFKAQGRCLVEGGLCPLHHPQN